VWKLGLIVWFLAGNAISLAFEVGVNVAFNAVLLVAVGLPSTSHVGISVGWVQTRCNDRGNGCPMIAT
jgi:hypothetical protein